MAKRKRAKRAAPKKVKRRPAKKQSAKSKPAKKTAAKKGRTIILNKIRPQDGATLGRLESFRVTFNRAISGLLKEHFTLTGTTETVDEVVPNLALGAGTYKRDFEVVLTNPVDGPSSGTLTVEVELDGEQASGSLPSPQARNGDKYEKVDTWEYDLEAENKAERVRLVVPTELHRHVEAMDRRNPDLVRSIVRSIFGSHEQAHFGIRRIIIESDPPKGKAPFRPWDKSCL